MIDVAVRPAQALAQAYPRAERLLDLPIAWAERDSAALALSSVGGDDWSRQELLQQIATVQGWLRAAGVQSGDRIAIMCDNSPRMVASYLAAIGFGAIAVPLNTALPPKAIQYALLHAEVVALIADPIYARGVLEVSEQLHPDQILVTADASMVGCAWPVASATWDVRNVGQEEDLAQIIYTSGTTGAPKGVMLSHRTMLNSAWFCASVMHEAREGMVLYTSMPLFHCGAQQVSLWTSLTSGAHLVISPRFSASTFWQQMRDYRVDHFNFIGQMLSILCAAPESEGDRDHTVSLAVGGGPKTVWREFEERFGVGIVEMYGMSETFSGCVSHRPGHGRVGTAGKALPYVDVRVASEGVAMPAGSRGEIQLRPVSRALFFSGYFKDPDGTGAAWDGDWLRTKDVGSLDADGYLTFHERVIDIIRHGGENVSAAYIEEILGELPTIRELAALPVPSPLGEQDVMVAVVMEPQASALDVWRYAESALPSFAIPEFVLLVDKLPRTETMRVKKHELAARVAEAVRRPAEQRSELAEDSG